MADADRILEAACAVFEQTAARDIAHGDKRVTFASAKEIRERIALANEVTAGDPGDVILSGEVATL